MRKKLTVILALILTLALALPSAVLAEDIAYTFDMENGIIQAYNGSKTELVIPDAIDGVPVRGFAEWFLNYNEDITSLTVPDDVQSLVFFASDMTKLEKIKLPANLLFIGDGCLQSAESLKEITVPAGVRYIGEFFVTYAYKLESITFEGECPVILDSFYKMPSSAKVYVPDDQFEAYKEALEASNCTGEILPSGRNAVPRELQFVREDFDFDAATGTVTAYHGQDTVVEIPSEIDGAPVRAIGSKAFEKSKVLYVGLPEGLETIGESAFDRTHVEYVKFPSTLRTIEKSAFENSYKGSRLDLPEGLESIGELAFRFSGIDGALVLPEGLKVIGPSAFSDSIVFDEIYFPSTLEEIGEKAFHNCLFSYACFAGYEVPAIDPNAFTGYILESLADIDTPWDITRAQWEAYKAVFEPMGFENLTVWRNNPASALPLTYIEDDYDENGFVTGSGGDVAEDLTVYTDVWKGDVDVSVVGIAAGAFKGNQVIRSFYPHHCEWFTTIGDEAFADSSLEYFEMFDSITTIGAGAFRNCVNMRELILPPYLTEIGEGAFDGCTGLEKVTVLCDALVIPDGSFADCPLVLIGENAAYTDITALNAKLGRGGLTTVRRIGDPLPEPVGEEGAPYFGIWHAFDMVVQGQHYDPAAFGSEIRLTLDESGAYEIFGMDGNLQGGLWGVSAEGVQIDGTPVTLTNEGWLYTVEEGVEVTFYKEGTPKPITGPQPVGEAGAPYVGEWVLSAVIMGDTSLDPAEFGMATTLTLNEDSTFVFVSGEDAPTEGYWSANENGASLMGVTMTLDAEGALLIAEEDGTMRFTHPRREIGEAGAPYVGIWHLYDMVLEGQHYDPAMFGSEVVLTLNDDTTYEVIGFGGITESGEWSLTENGAVADEMVMSLNEEGYLYMEQESLAAYFYKEGTEKPAAREPEPVGEAGAPYVGTWTAASIEMGGVSFKPADFGIAMTLTLDENGTFVMVSGEDPAEHGPWSVDENGASLMGMLTLALDENGMLVLEEDSMVMRFAREGAEAPAALDERCLPYVGTWYGIWLETGNNKVDPRAAWGMNITLTLNEDGTGTLDYMGSDGGKRWGWDAESEYVYYGLSDAGTGAATPLTLENSLLRYGTQYSGFILMSLDPNAVWQPATPEPTEAPTPVPTAEPTARPTAAPTPVNVAPVPPTAVPTAVPTAAPTATPAPFDPVGTRLVCSKASSGGFPLDPAMLGGEYAIELRADGKAVFTVAGMKLDPLPWARSGNDYVMDYYGTELRFVVKGDSLELDYMGAMLLTFTRP